MEKQTADESKGINEGGTSKLFRIASMKKPQKQGHSMRGIWSDKKTCNC